MNSFKSLLSGLAISFTLAIPVIASAASINGAFVNSTHTAAVIDGAGNQWKISGGFAERNGAKLTSYSGVIYLLFYNGVMYEQLSDYSSWNSYTGGYWVSRGTKGDPRVASASGSSTPPASSLVDASHGVWALTGGKAYLNGAAAGYTENISKLTYKNGVMEQTNSSNENFTWNGSNWVATGSATPTPTPTATSTSSPSDTSLPSEVKTVGYSDRVFFDDFDNTDSIDIYDKEDPTKKYNWYMKNYNSGDVTPPGYITQHNVVENGVTTTAIRLNPNNASLFGALKIKVNNVGQNFGPQFAMKNGGGAYYEARMAFGQTGASTNAWPSFWAFPTQHMLEEKMYWNGNAANEQEHFVENDIMEYFHDNKSNKYNSTLHDWYGVYDTTCAGQVYCQAGQATQAFGSGAALSIASTETHPVFHRFGSLWIPSVKQANGTWTQGSITWFLDGVKVGEPLTWNRGDMPATPTDPVSPWKFANMDTQTMSLILNSGSQAFVYVDYVGVWQKP